MKQVKRMLHLALTMIMVFQTGFGATALAESSPPPQPVASPKASASPSPSPTPSVAATPSPTPAPQSPSGGAGGSPAQAPTGTPAPSPKPATDQAFEPRAAQDDEATSPNSASGQIEGSAVPQQAKAPEAPEETSHDQGSDEAGCAGGAPGWAYDVAASKWVAADKDSFSCNEALGRYESPKYHYDQTSGWYQLLAQDEPATAAPAGNQPKNEANPASDEMGSDRSHHDQTPSPVGDNQPAATASNQLSSDARSGSVTAKSNVKVGDMQSGTASATANLLNLLASAWSLAKGGLQTFSRTLCDFGQTCNGDIRLDPSQLTDGEPVAADGALDVHAKSSGTIENNIDLSAASGNATAAKNAAVGNIKTGDAAAQANIMNLINSFIKAGSSFFGVLNIFGNLKGDILFPDGFLDGFASMGQDTPVTNADGTSGRQPATNNLVQNVVGNNITTTAQSGTVRATKNGQIGAVISGDAATGQNTFNLANTSLISDNAVLVMVNVLGHWLGKIMTLPGTGTTGSALMTGGAAQVSKNAPVSGHRSLLSSITNNIHVNAKSGDASASRNGLVGDITTGSAKAAANVANIVNSMINAKKWFGVLVINVFGDWQGDLNHDSDAGNDLAPSTDGQNSIGANPLSSSATGENLRALAAGAPVMRLGRMVESGAINVEPGRDPSGGGVGIAPTGLALAINTQAPASTSTKTAVTESRAAAAKGQGANILLGIAGGALMLAGILVSFLRRIKR